MSEEDSEKEEDWNNVNADDFGEFSEGDDDDSFEPSAESEASVTNGGSVSSSASSVLSRIALNPYKAGLSEVDRDHVNKVIYDVSKGSRFFKREQRQDEQISKKIESMLKNYHAFLQRDVTTEKQYVDNLIRQLEVRRDLSRIIVHIDMDAFYANVEIKDNPSLKGKPMAVGGTAMLSTASYEARKFGVRSAMPGYIAKKLCPQLIIVPPNFDKYIRESNCVKEILAQYDPNFSSAGLDEAYLDITECLSKRPDCDAEQLVQEIRQEIFKRTQLTASAGIAPNKMLAKISSDRNKPNGQFRLANQREAVMDFIKNLSVRKIGGIGKVMERLLVAIGITTVGDLYEKRVALHALFLKSSFEFLLNVSIGVGNSFVDNGRDRKSIGCERTFESLSDPQALLEKCDELSEKLACDLEERQLSGKTLTIKLKTSDFDLRTRAISLSKPIHQKSDIFTFASQLLRVEIPSIKSTGVRLMGLRLSSLKSRVAIANHGIDRFLVNIQSDAIATEHPANITVTSDDNEAECIPDASCPVCARPLGRITNTVLNQHIDVCLNSSALHSSTAAINDGKAKGDSKKRRLSKANDSPSPRKQSATSSSHSASKSLLHFFSKGAD